MVSSGLPRYFVLSAVSCSLRLSLEAVAFNLAFQLLCYLPKIAFGSAVIVIRYLCLGSLARVNMYKKKTYQRVIYIYIYMYICICSFNHSFTHSYNLYIYIYIYICIHIYIFTHLSDLLWAHLVIDLYFFIDPFSFSDPFPYSISYS